MQSRAGGELVTGYLLEEKGKEEWTTFQRLLLQRDSGSPLF